MFPRKTVLLLIAWSCVTRPSLGSSLGARTSRHEECSNRHYQRCMKLIHHLSESNIQQTTLESLNKMCRKWQQTVACIDHHQARCFTEQQSRLFNQVLATPRQYLSKLCGNPDLQQEYLKFAQCDKDITNNDLKCGLVFKKVLNISQDQPSREAADHSSVERVLVKNCCTFHEYLRCKKQFLTRDCGENANQFFETHIKRISAPFAEEQCGAFLHRCSSTGYRVVKSSFVVILALTLLLLIRLC